MIGLLLALLSTGDAVAAEPLPVAGVPCQRAVTFATPYRWRWSADHPDVVDATALVVRADAELLRPRDVGQRVLYVEGWPAEVLWQDGEQALVLVPIPVPDAGARVWFGEDALPETVDAADRDAALRAAATMGAWAPKVRTGPLAWPAGATRRALVTALRGWMETCVSPGGPTE